MISFMSNILSCLERLCVRCWVGLALRVPGLKWEEGRQRPAVVVGCVLGSFSLLFDLPTLHCFLLVRFPPLLFNFIQCLCNSYNNNIHSLQLGG